jgi:hypothetical protein
MDTKAKQYREAANAALTMAAKAADEATKQAWLRHADDWSPMADEIEKKKEP